LARTLTETLDPREICTRIVENVPALFGVAASTLRLVRPDGGLESVAYGGSEVVEQFTPGNVLPAGAGVAGRAIAEGRAVWSANLLDDPEISMYVELRERIEGYCIRAGRGGGVEIGGRG